MKANISKMTIILVFSILMPKSILKHQIITHKIFYNELKIQQNFEQFFDKIPILWDLLIVRGL